jgi:chorismate--pyruvate lyase
LPHQRTIDWTEQGWRRNTLYNWYHRPLLISETFLAEFFKG